MAQAVTIDSRWLEAQLAAAPVELAARTRFYLGPRERLTPNDLVEASLAALDQAIGQSMGRDGALDLLVADGLLTLALAAQAEVNLDGVDDLKRRVLERYFERGVDRPND